MATGLNSSTAYTIGTRTVGTTGLVKPTWVNSTAKTAPIPVSNLTARVWQPQFTQDKWFGSIPLTVQFTSLNARGADSYLWDFGDNTNSTKMNPVHTYSYPGILQSKTYRYLKRSRNLYGKGICFCDKVKIVDVIDPIFFSERTISGGFPLLIPTRNSFLM